MPRAENKASSACYSGTPGLRSPRAPGRQGESAPEKVVISRQWDALAEPKGERDIATEPRDARQGCLIGIGAVRFAVRQGSSHTLKRGGWGA